MTTQELPRPLRGIIPPLVTPLSGPDELDVDALDRLIDHVLVGGVAGLFILGTTGEAPALSYRLRRELIDHTCRLTRRRVPVLVGVTDPSLTEAVALACHAADAGADAVVAAPPYYFRPSPAELLHFMRSLATWSPLPLLLYNMPAHTKVAFTLDTVRRAMAIDKIVGLKDSCGDMGFFHAVLGCLAERPDWTLLIGPEHLTAEAVLFGGHGGVNGGANLEPSLFVALYEAAVRRDWPRVTALQQQVLRLGRVYQVGGGESAYLQGLKCALATRQLCRDVLADPMQPLGDAAREQVRQLVAGLDALPAVGVSL